MSAFPIRNEHDRARALRRIEALWAAEHGTPEADELEVLSALVEAFEERHHPLPPGDPIDVVRYKMRELGLSQNKLASKLGWRSGRISEVLGHKRPLTISMVRQLSDVLGIAPGLLISGVRPSEEAASYVLLPPDLLSRVRRAAAESGETVEAWVSSALDLKVSTLWSANLHRSHTVATSSVTCAVRSSPTVASQNQERPDSSGGGALNAEEGLAA